MTELGLILALCMSCVFVAGYRTRRAAVHSIEPQDSRLLRAVDRVCGVFFQQQLRLLGFVAGGVLAMLSALIATSATHWQQFAVPLLAVAAGVGGCSLVALHSLRWSMATVSRKRSADTSSTEWSLSLQTELNWSSLSSDAAALSLCVLAFAGSYLFYRASAGQSPGLAAWNAAVVLPAGALGAASAGAVFQIAGNNFQMATAIAGSAARQVRPVLVQNQQLNPGWIAEVSGGYLGAAVSRRTDAFCSSTLSISVLALLGASIAKTLSDSSAVLGLVALPAILLAVALLASSLVAPNVVDEPGLSELSPTSRIAYALICLSGLGGAALWLFGFEDGLAIFGCGGLGLVAGLVASSRSSSTPSSSRAAAESRSPWGQTHLNADSARAIGLGLQRMSRPIAVAVLCLGGAWSLGGLLAVPSANLLGLTVALSVMVGCNSLHHCSSLLGPLTLAASTATASGPRASSTPLGIQAWSGSGSHAQAILAGCCVALIAALSLPAFAPASAVSASKALAPEGTTQAGHPGVLFAGFVGATWLMFHVGSVLRLSSRAVSRVGDDLFTYIQSPNHPGAKRTAQPDGRGYGTSVQVASEAATQSLLPVVILATVSPLGLALILRSVGPAVSPRFAITALMMFSAVAALTGCLISLASHCALASLPTGNLPTQPSPEQAVRLAGGGESNSTNTSPIQAAHYAADYLGRSVSPAALLGLEATLAATLAAAPYVF